MENLELYKSFPAEYTIVLILILIKAKFIYF